MGELAEVFGWGPEEMLAMPARRFFSMLEVARDIKARQYQDLCYIAAIPKGTQEYLTSLIQSFKRKPGKKAGLTGKAAHDALLGMFPRKGVKGGR